MFHIKIFLFKFQFIQRTYPKKQRTEAQESNHSIEEKVKELIDLKKTVTRSTIDLFEQFEAKDISSIYYGNCLEEEDLNIPYLSYFFADESEEVITQQSNGNSETRIENGETYEEKAVNPQFTNSSDQSESVQHFNANKNNNCEQNHNQQSTQIQENNGQNECTNQKKQKFDDHLIDLIQNSSIDHQIFKRVHISDNDNKNCDIHQQLKEQCIKENTNSKLEKFNTGFFLQKVAKKEAFISSTDQHITSKNCKIFYNNLRQKNICSLPDKELRRRNQLFHLCRIYPVLLVLEQLKMKQLRDTSLLKINTNNKT